MSKPDRWFAALITPTIRMRRHRSNRLLIAVVVFASVHASAADPRIDRRLAELRKSPLELYAFLYRMPKGGDLHNHLSGAVYAESFLRAAAVDQLCIDPKTMALVKHSQCGPGLSRATDPLTDNTLANALIDAFSMRNFVAGAQSAHDHFFATFDKFGAVDNSHNGEFAAEVTQRAADQNESYLELMALSGGSVLARGKNMGFEMDFDITRRKLEAAGLADAVADLRDRVDRMEANRKRALGCAAKPDSPACRVVVRYVYQVLREFPQDQVFAEVMAGFALAASDPRVVAVNFVQPEDGLYSMRDYHLHMQMVDYAHRIYPAVHISLHAGELAPGLVPPEGLLFHIREAVELGHAERIGHGVDVMYEKDPAGLLTEMHDRHIAVEINLTSNDAILGVRGDRHPLPVYRKYRVPVALSTDDEGVSRSNLTLEYQRAVMEYNLTYSDLKEIVRNSLEYSFLRKDEKARLEADLEDRFVEFERTVK
jgi:adenosine deaminase